MGISMNSIRNILDIFFISSYKIWNHLPKPVIFTRFCLFHPVYFWATLYNHDYFALFVCVIVYAFRIYILFPSWNVNFLSYSAFTAKGSNFMWKCQCYLKCTQVKKWDHKSFSAKQNSPCLVIIYFIATAGNCGLIMHGLHTACALYEFALRTHNCTMAWHAPSYCVF